MARLEIEGVLELLRQGSFIEDGYRVVFPSGVAIWTANGRSYYMFHPDNGTRFTWTERMLIQSALKQGLLKKAVEQKQA